MLRIVVNMDGRFPEILIIAMVDIREYLWVPVNQREPAALHLYHHFMSFFEGMRNVRDAERLLRPRLLSV